MECNGGCRGSGAESIARSVDANRATVGRGGPRCDVEGEETQACSGSSSSSTGATERDTGVSRFAATGQTIADPVDSRTLEFCQVCHTTRINLFDSPTMVLQTCGRTPGVGHSRSGTDTTWSGKIVLADVRGIAKGESDAGKIVAGQGRRQLCKEGQDRDTFYPPAGGPSKGFESHTQRVQSRCTCGDKRPFQEILSKGEWSASCAGYLDEEVLQNEGAAMAVRLNLAMEQVIERMQNRAAIPTTQKTHRRTAIQRATMGEWKQLWVRRQVFDCVVNV